VTADSLFRWITLGGLGIGAGIGIYHRWRAHSGEPLARREEGLFILIALRLLALLAFCGMVAYLIQPDWMAWASLPLPTWARWCGVALGGANLLFLWWVMHTLGRNLTDTVVTRRVHTLVVDGPYRWVRHPFYLAALVAVVAITLTTASAFIGVGGILVFALLALRTPIEEAKLIERFGDDYRDYILRTGQFFPRFWR
jgi:protein-S-isoprenylcysteine O-methyltransferase Ste14